MLAYWVLPVLLVLTTTAGIRASPAEPRSFNADTSLQQQVPEDGTADVPRRFACPTGFFRLRRNCYYLSAGTAAWREAYFQCTARNATLAVLNRNGKDRILRNYLMGDQFRRLERWIGGIYNWRQMDWEWGESGNKVQFQNFADSSSMVSENNVYHCLVLDPDQDYKWNPRRCIEQKYYICEASPGRIATSRRRKNITDPLAPQNQRLRPPSRRDEYKHLHHNHNPHGQGEAIQRKQRNGTAANNPSGKLKSMRKKNWHHHRSHDDNQIWAHGIKFGSRPPNGSRRLKSPSKDKKERGNGRKHNPHHSNSILEPVAAPVSQVSPSPGSLDAFPADGRILTDERLQSLDERAYSPLFGKDYVREEVLLKV
ncbi:uncharacterized protein LOC106636231 [Copidosoma floridanum]|uniref:uncharacterized protein LOC106636231 n=1 Tax=Copidosoma floridanum TaxID=29053 RepID=UPI0006C986BC|nr:uncharacterized protein LOC106636231 [Copidosoma floridanum]